MLSRLARFTVKRRKAVLAGTAMFFVVAAMLGGGVVEKLSNGGFEDPNSESSRASRILKREFGARDPNLLLLVTAKHGTVDEPQVVSAGDALTKQLAHDRRLKQVVSYWSLNNAPPLRGADHRQALVLSVIRGKDEHVADVIKDLSPRYGRDRGVINVRVGGQAEVFRQIDDQIAKDLTRAELISFPITLILLVLVFGSLIAAGLPLAVGGLAIVGALLVLLGIASVTEVSIYSLNLTTAMGLGLAIDYSLFIVSRFREEVRGGLHPHDAVIRTVQTAGKTVTFSAMTVAISLAALVVFPLSFLRSFAYAGIAVSLLAAASAVVFLPALLAVIGGRVDSLRLWRRTSKPEGRGVWHRVAMFVMRRPLPIAIGVVVLLLALGLPFLHIEFGLPDDRVLPKHLSSRRVQDDVRRNFSSREAGALEIVAHDLGHPGRHTGTIDGYATGLSKLRGVARVDTLTGSYIHGKRVNGPGPLTNRFRGTDGTWFSVVPSVEPLSPTGERLARQVRNLRAPFPTLVTGPGAELIDSKASLFGRMPLAAALIALATFVLLFVMFGGFLVPVKALVINALSLSAIFGALVWIFQDGHLSGVLDFTPTGTIPATMPILMFCVAFGLSMDYEVFLLSRIKEEHDRTGNNRQSVALGLERTGRIVTAAAILISLVFIAVASSGVTLIKLFGVGLALAVLMDAFVIRATLVPAFMRLAGEANWWAPASLRRLYRRFGISDVESARPARETSTGEPTPEPARSR